TRPLSARTTLFPYTTLFRSNDVRFHHQSGTLIEHGRAGGTFHAGQVQLQLVRVHQDQSSEHQRCEDPAHLVADPHDADALRRALDRKSTRLNSSHSQISYAV